MNRTEHLEWCKARALEYLPDDPNQAFMSMTSDLGKHDETRDHAGIGLGMTMLLSSMLSTPNEMEKFITGFN